MNPSARTIITLNIERYGDLLKTECDSTKRTTILKLLAEEEAKLAGLPRKAPTSCSVPGSFQLDEFPRPSASR
jgi:hypothetical protein